MFLVSNKAVFEDFTWSLFLAQNVQEIKMVGGEGGEAPRRPK